jgi:hypothetical protein
MAVDDGSQRPVLVLGATGGQGGAVAVSSIRSPDMTARWEFLRGKGYQADITALRHDYPELGWTSFADWAQRTFRPGDPGSPMQP